MRSVRTSCATTSCIRVGRCTVGAVAGPAQLITPRLRSRSWTDDDRDDFARLNADPGVSRDLGGPVSRADSDRKLDRYARSYAQHGYSRWLVETIGGHGHHEFIGYAGVFRRSDPQHPLGPHDEIGWRLTRGAWGNGYATEASRAALADVFTSIGLLEVVSYTARDNHRSQAVMQRLDLLRDESRDFTTHYPVVGEWTGLVWSVTAS